METVYRVCFLFGAAFTAVSFFVGNAHLGHFHVGHHGHGHHAHGVDDRSPLAFLNLPALLAFLTWFGAAGYLISKTGMPALLAAPVAIVVGLAAGWLVVKLLAKVRAGEQVLDPADYRLPGTVGQLTVGIPAGGVGEIVFAKAGRRRSEAARAVDGRPLARGAEVVITAYERGVALVQPWDEFVSGKEGHSHG